MDYPWLVTASCWSSNENILSCSSANIRKIFRQPISTELLTVISEYVEGIYWKEALKILKLVDTRFSSLVAPPILLHDSSWESSLASPHPSFTDTEIFTKNTLPGTASVEKVARVVELLRSARWSAALEAVRLHRVQWPTDPFHDDDDVTTAVNMYCKHLDVFVVTRNQKELADVFSKLMESLFQVLAAVTGLEALAKTARAQTEHSNPQN